MCAKNNSERNRLTLYPTNDGSIVFFSEQWQEAFHSLHGAKQEAIALRS